MKRKVIIKFALGTSLFLLFIMYTLSLTFADIQPIGPRGSFVAYAGINKAIHELLGVNMTLYNITDAASVVAIFVAFGFALLGLCQWIKGRSIKRVDHSILVLGIFYIVVFGTYVFFEFNVINYRPVLINGLLEVSYPSSTTMLAMCVFPTAIMQFNRLIQNYRIKCAINALCTLFTAFMLIGRLLSGVHWFTDILGGLIFSIAMILLYSSADSFIYMKSNNKRN